jgi:uncharacterized protein YfdQ (DUF2303 family)
MELSSISEDTQDATAILKAGAALSEPRFGQTSPSDAQGFVVVPEGYKVEYIDGHRSIPAYHAGTVRLRDAKSFAAYVKDLDQGTHTRVYATLQPAAFQAVMDDHVTDEPGMRKWRAAFVVPHSREWIEWSKKDRQVMSQLDFATFVEDNLPDFVAPDGSTMMTMALNFEASKSGAFKSIQRLQNGDVNMQWVDETSTKSASGNVVMPSEFTIAVPVFENDQEKAQVTARLKYRVRDGSLSIWYELVRPHKTVESAFRQIWQNVETETGKTILLGSPE